MVKPAYKRVLLKISGEALAGSDNYGINKDALAQIAADIKGAHDLGVQIGLVVGAGNIFRGVAAAVQGIDRSSADYMGMLATVINCLALSDALENLGLETRVQTAIAMDVVAEPFICRRALRHLEKGRIVIFAAGTGNPYVTTDSAAALRANEIGAEVVIKATKVDGIYDKDPALHEDAKMYSELTYNDVISKDLKVMDATAITMCRDNNMPIITFNLTVPGNIRRIIQGEKIGTIVRKT